MKPPIPTSELRALAQGMGLTVGKRGALSSAAIQCVLQAQKQIERRAQVRTASRLAMALAPDAVRVATKLLARQKA